ncbi:MAG TPA: hypothetical protein VLA59_03375 [Patescibacteria group bacterium]|nr:hypothetical protein [Patescibacteria group bacterium]
MTALRLMLAAVVLALAGCGAPTPTPSSTPGDSALPSATPTASPAAPEPSASAPIALPEPGRPYDADDVLEAMRESRRPGGVPAELQDAEIAAQLAERLWTFDGEPWDAIAAGGACDASTCSLELSGGTNATGGEDVWRFSIDLTSDAVEVVDADLHAVPDETAAALDRWVRALDAGGVLDGLLTTAVRWLPPPAEDRFRLAYRSGDEEGSCSVDLELDAAAGRITEIVPSGC